MKKLFLVLLFCQIANIYASTFQGNIMRFSQPDGSVVDVRLFGTEYYMRAEGLDKYTVIRDPETKWICYAKLSQDGNELISTGVHYIGTKENISSQLQDLPIPLHLDISAKSRNGIIKQNKIRLCNTNQDSRVKPSIATTAGTPIHTLAGNIKGLCIVVDFPDEQGLLPVSEFDDFCNDLNYTNFGNNGSLRRYYSDISGGILDYENIVFGYYHAPLNFTDYDAMPYGHGAHMILDSALNWIQGLGFDFSTLTINTDGSIMAINLMYTGYPQAWAQGMWHHKGNFSGFSANGVFSNDYNCSPANDPLVIGVVAHENGHMIGKWPDTYKYDNTTGPDGIGSFDLMCGYGDGNNPVPPNPLFRSNVGWGRVVDVTNYNGLNSDTANSMTCYMYRNINDTNEFFLLESRIMNGRSDFIPDEGLTIWHIDRHGNNQTFHHEVFLEHADTVAANEDHACFHASFNTEFSGSTIPSSHFYNGSHDLRVWDIGPVGPIMEYKLGLGQPGPALSLLFTGLTGDDNSNGFVEPGEFADLNLDAINSGQVNSVNATLTCAAIGNNAGYVTVNSIPVQFPLISVSQSIPATCNITIHANTPLGTEVLIEFQLTDGIDTSYFFKAFIIGVQINMNNQTDSTCSAMFYDDGGTSNYNNDEDWTKTIFPSSNQQRLQVNFSEFDLEDETACAYDYLKIYDGPSIASPFIGIYCAMNSPGVISSTDPTGALTFEFHSDGGLTRNGWVAEISCASTASIEQVNYNQEFAIFPNPTADKLTVSFKNSSIKEIALYDVIGNEIFAQKIINQENLLLDLSKFSPGIYFLKGKSENRICSKKIIVYR